MEQDASVYIELHLIELDESGVYLYYLDYIELDASIVV